MIRLLAEQISRAQGLTIVVENRPGANQVVGTEAVSRAGPDGNTLLSINSAFITAPHLRKLTYDPRTSFEPISSSHAIAGGNRRQQFVTL